MSNGGGPAGPGGGPNPHGLDVEKIKALLLSDGWHEPKPGSLFLREIGIRLPDGQIVGSTWCAAWQETWSTQSTDAWLYAPLNQIQGFRYPGGIPTS
jgi:hypothetical protein